MLETTGLDDQDHLSVIGALGRAVSPKAPLFRAAWMQTATPQGISQPAEELDFLPLDGVDYTNNGVAAADLEDELSSLPQRPFRGERVVLTAIYITGAGVASDALFRLIITPAIYVGAVQVGATQGQMPGIAFGPNAFGVRLSFPTAGQGTRIYVPFRFNGVNATDRVIVAGGIFGRAVR